MMTARIDLTEDTNTVLDKIDNQTYLVQFDVSNDVFYLMEKLTKTQYNMPTAVQRELDSRYWKYRDPVYWAANYGP